jgi:hypothetical protein
MDGTGMMEGNVHEIPPYVFAERVNDIETDIFLNLESKVFSPETSSAVARFSKLRLAG